jgi:cardiolipin synthase A/B
VLPAEQTCELDRLLRTYGVPGASRGNSLRLCPNGEQAYQCLIDLIARARRSIHIATFIFEPDAVGQDILRRLTQRASEGVAVRLLMDDVGSLWTTRHFVAPLRRAGGRTAFFTPLLSRPFRGRTNLRNHRKIAVVDDSIAMAGGANIAAEYIGPQPDGRRWQDFSFIIEGPAVQQYAEIFRNDWAFASGEFIDPDPAVSPAAQAGGPALNGAILQIVPSGPDCAGDALLEAIMTVVYSARRRLWIVSPYFIPDEPLNQALVVAARRGVDLRVIVPEHSDHTILDLARGPYLREVQQAGGQVMLFRRGMLHAKILVADDTLAMAGSANMDRRSLFLNYEAAMFAYSPAEIELIADFVRQVMAHAAGGLIKPAVFHGLAESFVRLFAPLL